MLWVGIGVAVALVLLLVVSLSGKDEQAPAATAAKPLAKRSGQSEAAPRASTGRTRAAHADVKDEEEPEGSKVASIPPPPEAQKAKVVDLSEEVSAPSAPKPKPAKEVPSVPVEIDHFDDDDPTGPQALILVTAVGRTDPGRRRKHNEDAYLVLPDFSVFVIADGMGGYAAGEVASQLAVDVMGEAYKTKTFTGEPDPARPRRGDELVRAIEMANTAILTQARANEAQHGMGTTIVAARFSPNKQRVYFANVGDARAYRIRGGVIKQLTTDHTLGAAGITGPAAAKLSRAVGIQDTVEVDLEIDSPQVGDHYMLCSDGLSKMIPDDVIKDIILSDKNLDAVITKLIDTANDRGGRDNISVILVRVDEVQKVPSEKPSAKSKTA